MDLPVRNHLPHEIPQWVPEGSWFFITIACEPRGLNQLCVRGIGDSVLNAVKHYHENLVWHCRLCLLMPDHLHAIIAFPETPGMRRVILNWKRYLARNSKICWQRDFFDHRLRNDAEVQEKISYVLMNPVRKSMCEKSDDWLWIYRPRDRPPPLR